ncbi:aminotransferase, class V [Luminiphilus syltensis NOR5-1B]|uniref:Aminotransferase, class V n=1 Tax=Luminiphilus syltensis NOR5-1B TaxID=565045 RepID=B8KTX9_9GAMM|nr:aminotransferase class V-fold PLP-dependent enzyme [Luminiphilus syltensis]EED34066.1 aminotransferase, class V [Luminiphilus syltensis NOR5-1B]
MTPSQADLAPAEANEKSLELLRSYFPILAEQCYFNACSYGPLSLQVEAALNEYMTIRHEQGARWDIYVEKAESTRTLLADLLCCPADDVSISTSVSQSLNTLLSAFDFSAGRNGIVTTDFDFPTTAQILLAQEARGAKVKRVAVDDTGTALQLHQFDELIDDNTLMVQVPLVCYRNGVWTDIDPIVKLAHSRGALVLIDAYQGIGTRRFDVTASGADFLVGGCTKYLLAGAGTGFMYVRDSMTNGIQPVATGWFAQANPYAMDIYHNEPHPTARRFEAGTPNAVGLFAAEAGLKLLLEVGMETVERNIAAVNYGIKEMVYRNGWDLVTPRDRHGAMLAIRSTDAPALVQRLAGRKVILTERDNNIRVAPHFYNSTDDVTALEAALKAEAELLPTV